MNKKSSKVKLNNRSLKNKSNSVPTIINYWLLKTEPSEFGIDDLKKKTEKKKTARWDGVRNYQARNFLRDSLKEGDIVIIYHSSIKEPGAAGLGKIVGPPYSDPSQFDSKSPYFDPKAKRENAPWIARDIQFVEKFPNLVTLAEMRQNSKLSTLLLLRKGSRLSVQPVNLPNFEEICLMAKAKYKPM